MKQARPKPRRLKTKFEPSKRKTCIVPRCDALDREGTRMPANRKNAAAKVCCGKCAQNAGGNKKFDAFGSVTDASYAIGVWIPSTSRTTTAKLGHYGTGRPANLVAIDFGCTGSGMDILHRLSCCRAALQHVMVLPHEQLAEEINDLHTQALNNSRVTVLQWLPAHCGVAGNVQADRAAAAAHRDSKITSVPFTRR